MQIKQNYKSWKQKLWSDEFLDYARLCDLLKHQFEWVLMSCFWWVKYAFGCKIKELCGRGEIYEKWREKNWCMNKSIKIAEKKSKNHTDFGSYCV